MPSIDKAYVELGTDTRPFERGMDRSERRFHRSVESMSARAVRLALADESELGNLERAAATLGDIRLLHQQNAAALAGAVGAAGAFSAALAQGHGPIRAIGAGLGRALDVVRIIAVEAAKWHATQLGLAAAIRATDAANRPMLSAALRITKQVHRHSLLIKSAWYGMTAPLRAVNYLLGRTMRLAAGLATGLMMALAPLMAPLLLGAGAGLGAGIGFAIKQAGDLEAQIAQVRKTTGLEGGPLDRLIDNLKELSTTLVGVDLSEVMTIAEEAGRLGLAQQGTDAVLDYVKAVSMIKVALDDIPVEESSRGVAILLNNFKLGTDRTLGLASALNKLADTSNATARDILDVTQRASLAARQLGLTATQTLALATAAKAAGVETEVAGTAISQILARMTQNIGQFAEIAGMELDAFSTMLRADPLSALEAVAGGIRKLDPLKASEGLSGLGLDGMRVVMTMRALADNFDMVRDKVALADEEFLSGASILEEVKVQSETTWKQLQRLWNQVKLLAAELGAAFLPAIRAAGDHLGAFLDRIREGTAGGVLDALAGALERVVDVIAEAFEDPQDRAALFFGFLDVLVAATRYAAAEIEDAIVEGISRAIGRSTAKVRTFLDGLSVVLPAGVLPGLQDLGRAADAATGADNRSEAAGRRAELEGAMRGVGGMMARMAAEARARREGRAADRDEALGLGAAAGPIAGGTGAAAGVDPLFRALVAAFEQGIQKRIDTEFTPDQIDAEMRASRESILKSLERAAEDGLIDQDAYKALKKSAEADIDRRTDLARLERRRIETEREAEESLEGLAADRAEAVAAAMERAADDSIDIGTSGVADLGRRVQELAGRGEDAGKEQARLMKRLADIAEREEEIQKEQRDALNLIAREQAAVEVV